MKKRIIISIVFILLAIQSTFCTVSIESNRRTGKGLEFYISPTGNDLSKSGPFASFDGALQRVLKLKEAGNQKEVTFIVQNGLYSLTSPIVIDERFADLAFKVSFKAKNTGKVIVSGGRNMNSLQQQKDGSWFIDKNNVQLDNHSLFQLFVNDKRINVASTDFSKEHRLRNVKEIVTKDSIKHTSIAVQQFKITPKDFVLLSSLTNNEINQIYIMCYLNWDVTIKRIDSISFKDSLIYITGKPMAPWNPMNASSCYQIINHKNFSIQSDNTFFSTSSGIYFNLSIEAKSNKIVATIPLLDQLVIIKGLKDNKIKNFSFSGISFNYTKCPFPSMGYEASQAAISVNAAIEVNNAQNITFENCSLKHTGNYGIWFDVGCTFCKVIHCELSDLGAGGIRIGDPIQTTDSALMTTNNLISNNIINGCGRVIPSAVGIHIGQSAANEVSHNTIFDLYYTGISVGWVWGYGKSQSHNNIISYNNIHHIGWGRLNDMAGIYNLGVSPNNLIDHNIIHDVYTYTYGGWGIYTDEGSSNVTITNNLVYNTKSGGFHQNYGANNLLQNNIFLNGLTGQLECTRIEDHHSFTFKNNVVIWNKGRLLTGPWDKISAVIDSNLYFNTRNLPITYSNKSFSDWNKMGYDIHSFVGNPGFEFDGDKKIIFKDRTLLDKINFRTVDLSQIGVLGKDDWKGKEKIDNELQVKFDKLFVQ